MAKVNRHRQSGDVLIVTMAVLVVIFLGFLYVMRNVMSDTQMAGNNLARQKSVQVADVAMRNLSTMIFNAYAEQPLEQSATTQPWYRVAAAGQPPAIAIPDTYWANCLGAAAASRCGTVQVSIDGTALPYTALAVVQSTGRQPDIYACNLKGFAAYYYDVYINVVENSGVAGATTETVYKLCVYDPASNP